MRFLAISFLFLSLDGLASSHCDADAKKYCQGVDPGKGQLAKCLGDYEGSLSAACSKELKDFKKNTASKNPCFENLADLCPEVPAEGPKLELCLLKNESRLSGACARDFAHKKGNIITRNVCAYDTINHCYAQVSAENGSVNHCLIRNRGKLSGFCKKKTEELVSKMKKQNPCFDDTEKYCPSFVRFADIQECLEKKMDVLAPNCKTTVQTELNKARANPCYRDLSRHCVPNITPQQQRECLALNEEHLSNACRQYRVQEKEKVNKMVKFCENDRLKFCANEPFENGKVAKCLRKNKEKLSKACGSLL